jgi:hypothetical protein
MSIESHQPVPPPVVQYREPELPPPVTLAERVAVFSGYLLLAGGLLALPWLTNRAGRGELWLAMTATILGAGITAFCYISNAIRRK